MRTLSYLLKQYEEDPATAADLQKVYNLAKADDLEGINKILKSYAGSNDLPAIADAAKAAFATMPIIVSIDPDDKDLAAALLELTRALNSLATQAI